MKLELYYDDFQKVRDLITSRDFRGVIEALQGRKPIYLKAPHCHRAAYFHTLGRAHSKIGNYTQADQCFNSALSAAPKHHKIKLEIIESYIQRGELRDAEKILVELFDEGSIFRGGYNRRLHMLMGSFFKLTGDYAAAYESYMAAHHLERQEGSSLPKEMDLVREFGESTDMYTYRTRGIMEYADYLRHIDSKESPPTGLCMTFLKNCTREVKTIDDKVQCLAALSHLSLTFNDMVGALEYNHQALALDANHPKSLTDRIRVHFAMGKNEEAIDFYHKDKDLIAEDPRATLALAKTLSFAGLYELSSTIAKDLLTRRDLPHQVFKSTSSLISSLHSIQHIEASQHPA